MNELPPTLTNPSARPADAGPVRAEHPDPALDSEGGTPPTLVQGGPLKLAQALYLLQREGLALPADLEPGSQPWLQALVDALCTLSSSDPLTGLVNRRQFEAALDGEVDRVARSSETALLLLADIDHFKRVNDTYGHRAGDLVIQAVARSLLECVRPMDTVARIGGEEFAIVLPNCPPAFARTVAERIRCHIETLAVPVSATQALTVSISIGGAFAPQWVRSSRQFWYERADQQLYRAKTGGRNQACLESPAVSEVSTEERELLFSVPPALVPDESEVSS